MNQRAALLRADYKRKADNAKSLRRKRRVHVKTILGGDQRYGKSGTIRISGDFLKRVTGRSLFYRCPNCRILLKKRSAEGISGAVGFTSCSACGASFSYNDVYRDGIYDLPEVEGKCPHCSAYLRGPEEELLGKSCPSCNRMLPATTEGSPSIEFSQHQKEILLRIGFLLAAIIVLSGIAWGVIAGYRSISRWVVRRQLWHQTGMENATVTRFMIRKPPGTTSQNAIDNSPQEETYILVEAAQAGIKPGLYQLGKNGWSIFFELAPHSRLMRVAPYHFYRENRSGKNVVIERSYSPSEPWKIIHTLPENCELTALDVGFSNYDLVYAGVLCNEQNPRIEIHKLDVTWKVIFSKEWKNQESATSNFRIRGFARCLSGVLAWGQENIHICRYEEKECATIDRPVGAKINFLDVDWTVREFRGNVYLATDKGLFRSKENPVKWEKLPLNENVRVIGTLYWEHRLLAGFEDGKVLVSSDDRNWKKIRKLQGPVNVFFGTNFTCEKNGYLVYAGSAFIPDLAGSGGTYADCIH